MKKEVACCRTADDEENVALRDAHAAILMTYTTSCIV